MFGLRILSHKIEVVVHESEITLFLFGGYAEAGVMVGRHGRVVEHIFPEDILDALKADPVVWANYTAFSAPYRRIRVAYIDAARQRPAEFEKRLSNFISKTRENKLIVGFGGVDKYYK